MYEWLVDGEEEVRADKVIVSDSGVLMFFEEAPQGNLMVRSFRAWGDCELVVE